MTVTLACPQDENPLSYANLDGEWAIWSEIAQKFERKVPTQDRGDIRHNIILELALARAKDGHKPFSEALMCRIASYVVADYWRTQYKFTNGLDCGSCSQKQRQKCRSEDLYSQCPKAIKTEYLSKQITDANGNVTEFGDTIADDKAIDIGAWIDARTFLLSCPHRLLQIAHKIRNGDNLTPTDSQYLWRFRKREQNTLLAM